MLIPWSTSVDVAYVGHHNYNAELTGQVNAVDIGSAFDPSKQDPTSAPSATPGASSLAALFPDLVRGYRGYTAIAMRNYDGWRSYHAIQFSINRRFRNGIAFGFNDAITLQDIAKVAPRYDHDASGQPVLRADQGEAQELLQDQLDPRHLMKATALWQLPDHEERQRRCAGAGLDRQRLAAVGRVDGCDGYAVLRHVQLPERRKQREPDRVAGLRRADPDRRRCRAAGAAATSTRSSPPAAFQGPLVGSTGLESSNNYLKGCFASALDLSLQREISLGGSRRLQFRVDAFNAPNQALITGRVHIDDAQQPERSGDDREQPVQRGRHVEPDQGAAAERRIRRA